MASSATNNLFQIRLSRLGGTISGTSPVLAVPMGTAFEIVDKDPDTGVNRFALANGRAAGFVTREVRVGAGLTDSELVDQLMGLTLMETPFEAGKACSIEQATHIEAEGVDFVLSSGTGAITAGTAAGSKLSFLNGKFHVAQATEFAQFRLVQQMTPDIAGNVRIYVEEIEGYLVP